MKKGILVLLFLLMALPVQAGKIVGNNTVIVGTLFNEPVIVEDSINLSFINVTFNGTLLINGTGASFDTSVVINQSKLFGDVTTAGNVTVDARNSFWNSEEPLNSLDGCPSGTGVAVSSEVQTAPWFRDLNLTDSSSNCRPVLLDIVNQQAVIDALFTLQTNCTDFNNDSLVHTDDSPLFTIGASNGLISFTPTINDGGTTTVEITCSDSEFIDSDTFDLSIGVLGYVVQYQGSDLAAVTADVIVGFGATIFQFSGLLALFIILGLVGVGGLAIVINRLLSRDR